MSLEKYDALIAMLASDIGRGLVGVHLDPRCDGVVVPAQFRDQSTLKLDIAYGYNLPHLDIDKEEGIYAMFSFSGRRSGCTIPWTAIFGMSNTEGNGFAWPRPSVVEKPEKKQAWTPRIVKEGESG